MDQTHPVKLEVSDTMYWNKGLGPAAKSSGAPAGHKSSVTPKSSQPRFKLMHLHYIRCSKLPSDLRFCGSYIHITICDVKVCPCIHESSSFYPNDCIYIVMPQCAMLHKVILCTCLHACKHTEVMFSAVVVQC